MNRKLVVSIFLTFALTGCGSNSLPDSSNTEKSMPQAKGIKSDFVFMSDFIASLRNVGVDCVGYVKKDETLLAKEEGSCTYNGTTIYPVIFGSAKSTPELVDAIKAFGGYWLTSNNWAITVDDEGTARDLQAKLGVTVK
jgi:hypothetical protein